MADIMHSAGIDIGTSTTQVIFSDLRCENTGGFGSVPKIEITGKKIRYRSPIFRTPLQERGGEEQIDGEAVAALVRSAFRDAGVSSSELDTGAVIITGETARKRNAAQVLSAISELAGDFVSAAAGPDLESVLAGKGSGAVDISKNRPGIVANIDVGGGTSNICLFSDGRVIDTACLNIGGRMLEIENGRIRRIAASAVPVLRDMGITLTAGQRAEQGMIRRFADRLAELLAEGIGLKPQTPCLARCITNHGLSSEKSPDLVVFSGGVSACMQGERPPIAFGDIGDILGKAIRECPWFGGGKVIPADETVNATVIGAGNFSMAVSGSTILQEGVKLPKKNVPVYGLRLRTEADIPTLKESVRAAMKRFSESGRKEPALAFTGLPCPGFRQIEALAEALISALAPEIEAGRFPILLVEADIGKVLGQALRRRLGHGIPLICLDGISCAEGDFVDIGSPLDGGTAVPVVVKTLIFNSQVRA